MAVQPTILKLASIRLIPSDGLGKLYYYHSFDEANRALPSLTNNPPWSKKDLFIYFEVEWQGLHFYHDTIAYNEVLVYNPSFLQNYIQDSLEDILMLPNEHTFDNTLESIITSPGWQTEYLKIQTGSHHLYENILLFGEGMDSEAYLKKLNRVEAVFRKLKQRHPLIKCFFKSARAFLLYLDDVPNRTQYFKEKIKKIANKSIYHGFNYAAVDKITEVDGAKSALISLQKQINDELNIPDERFTVFGKEFYNLLPLDYKVLTTDIYKTTPLNAFQLVEFNDRLEATRLNTHSTADERSTYRELFYNAYNSVSNDLYSSEQEDFSHLDISRKTYQLLKRHQLSKKQLKNMFNLYDPFAVNLLNYSDLVVQ